MRKERTYELVKFSSEKIKEGISKWSEKLPEKGRKTVTRRAISFRYEAWDYDFDEEFYADFNKKYGIAYYEINFWAENGTYYKLRLCSMPKIDTTITIEAPSRAEIEDIFYVFEKDWQSFKIPEPEQTVEEYKLAIFIGHGRSTQWRELKDHLSDKHGYQIVAYETGARAGHSIRDILDDMVSSSVIALLVLTGEDELKDGKLSARPNVIHETGLFQEKLGFGRAIVLLEEGAEEFSNLYGIQQIRFSKNNIKETFGEVLATIKREFK